MSDDNDPPAGSGKPYKVGYKKPPEVWKFKKGAPSPNPKGRPRKADKRGPLAVLDDPVLVREGGELRRREPKDLTLRKLVRAALDEDDTRALFYLIEQFARVGEYSEAGEREIGSVVALPTSLPFPMARWLAERFGLPPWSDAEVREGRIAYEAERSEVQAKIDVVIGYPSLNEGDAS